MRLPRWRSLRFRALAVVLAVVLTPLAVVWWADLMDQNAGTLMKQRIQLALEQGGEVLLDDPSRLEAIARRHQVWVRVLEPAQDGGWAVVSSFDYESDLGDLVDAFFFPPEQAPSLRTWDTAEPDLARRPEVVVAQREDQGSRCALSASEDLLVCAAALRLEDAAGNERLLHVEKSSRRAIRTLHEQRYQMVKLTMVVAVVGLVLGLWLGWRFVKPIEVLRQQIADRRTRGRGDPVSLDRNDELGDLATAFNGLLEALEGLDLTSADGRAGIGTLLSEIERACPGAILQQAARIELRSVGWPRPGGER